MTQVKAIRVGVGLIKNSSSPSAFRGSAKNLFFCKNGPNPASFLFLFSFFSHDKDSTNTLNEKGVDGVLGTRTRGGRMVGTDESTELWRHPQ